MELEILEFQRLLLDQQVDMLFPEKCLLNKNTISYFVCPGFLLGRRVVVFPTT